MGHVRLGEIPKTRQWNEVVGLISLGANPQQIANATIRAAEQNFKDVSEDRGLVEALWLLMQLPSAARSEDFAQTLRECGFQLEHPPNLMELLSGFSQAVDQTLANNCGRTDLGEMAQMAAVETLAEVVGQRANNLFGSTSAEIQDEIRKLYTVKQFGAFARHFFSRLIFKSLDYFLSRVLARFLGQGERFVTLAEQRAFSDALEVHCEEASLVVEKFSGEWFSKTHWEEGGSDRDAVKKFACGAINKLLEVLKGGTSVDDS